MTCCRQCGHPFPGDCILPIRCSCGSVIRSHNGQGSQRNYPTSGGKCRTESATQSDLGHQKAAICRSDKCGHYNSINDTCQLVIDIGRDKGQERAGKIRWVESHPDAVCPADPPMFGRQL